MKFNEIYKYAFDDKDLLMEVPHIKLPLAYSLDRDEIYFDAKVEKIPNDPSSMEIVDHFVKRFKKRKLNKMQREIVYKNDMLNDIMNLKMFIISMQFFHILNYLKVLISGMFNFGEKALVKLI